MRGKLISFEGIEGLGKSTLVSHAKIVLGSLNQAFITTREPGGTPFAETIRSVLLAEKPSELILPETELCLMFASRFQHAAHTVLPALESGQWVLSDRFTDASYAYQIGGGQLPEALAEILEEQMMQQLKPDLTFLLDGTVALSRSRLKERENLDRIEQKEDSFFERARQAYLTRAKRFPERFVVLNAADALEELKGLIESTLKELVLKGDA